MVEGFLMVPISLLKGVRHHAAVFFGSSVTTRCCLCPNNVCLGHSLSFLQLHFFDGELVVDLDRMFLLCRDIVFLALDMR